MARWLILSLFACLTMIGTLLHEAGHYIAGIMSGYRPVLHYNRTETEWRAKPGPFNEWIDTFIRSAAGPFVNMLIGSLVFFFLLRNYKRLSERQVIACATIVFFWSREIVTLMTDLAAKRIFNHVSYSDEQRMSLACDLPENFFSVIFGCIALALLAYTAFVLVPERARTKFIFWGGAGCVIGYIVWFLLLGPAVLP